MIDAFDVIIKLVKETTVATWVVDKTANTLVVNSAMEKIQQDCITYDLYAFCSNCVAASEQSSFTLVDNNGTLVRFDVQDQGTHLFIQAKNTSLSKNRQFSIDDYRSLFEYTPVPIWEEDFSAVKFELDKIVALGNTDIRAYFAKYPDEVARVASHLVVNDVNQAVVDLNEAESKEYLLAGFWTLRDKNSTEYAIKQFEAIVNGDDTCEFDAELRTFKGNVRYVRFSWKVVKGYERNYGKVFLITADLTARIAQENLELQNNIREKEVLLKEVHHRVKNNLQIISSLLNLQSRNSQDPAVRHLFDMSLNRIHSMATVHELLYRSKDISHININDYVNRLIQPLLESIQGESMVSVDLDVHNVVLHINTAIPLGLIINEIVTNALVHGVADCENPHVYLRLLKSSEGYKMEIGDNGKGLKDEDFEGDSLGLQLILSLVDQINGKMNLNRELKGTHFVIEFEEISGKDN